MEFNSVVFRLGSSWNFAVGFVSFESFSTTFPKCEVDGTEMLLHKPTNPPTNQAIPSVKCPGKAWPNAVALRWRRNSIPTNLHVRWHGGNAWKKWQKAIMLWLWNGLEDEFFQEGGWLLLVFESQNAARGRINYAHGIMGTLKIPWSWSHDLHVWAPIMPIIFMPMIPHGSPLHNASLRGTVGCTSLFSNPLEGRRIPGWMGGSKCCPHISLSAPAHEDVKDVVLMQVPSIVLCLGTGVFSGVELWGVKLKWKQVWMETIGGKYTLRLRANIIVGRWILQVGCARKSIERNTWKSQAVPPIQNQGQQKNAFSL